MSRDLHGHDPICAAGMILPTDLKNIPAKSCRTCKAIEQARIGYILDSNTKKDSDNE